VVERLRQLDLQAGEHLSSYSSQQVTNHSSLANERGCDAGHELVADVSKIGSEDRCLAHYLCLNGPDAAGIISENETEVVRGRLGFC
jgi:hypothetical protein